MKLSAIKELIREIEIDHPGKDLDLAIPVVVGEGFGQSSVSVTSLVLGHGKQSQKLFVQTAMPLTSLTYAEVEDIRLSAQKGLSWHAKTKTDAALMRAALLDAALRATIDLCLSSGLDESNPVLMKAQMALPQRRQKNQ